MWTELEQVVGFRGIKGKRTKINSFYTQLINSIQVVDTKNFII